MIDVENTFKPRSKQADGEKCTICDDTIAMNILSPGFGYFADLLLAAGSPVSIRIVVCEECKIKMTGFFNDRERDRWNENKNTLWLGTKHAGT